MDDMILKRFFSKNLMHDLLDEKKVPVFDCVVKRYIKDPNGKAFETLVSEIYTYMGKNYRTEYYYKNTLLNKLLFRKHDYKKTIALTEVPIGNSKADFVMINGKGVVYEIKTELDNLERLGTQIKDYYKAFTNVVIVTYSDNVDKVKQVVSKNVGIMILTPRNALKVVRNPVECKDELRCDAIFKALRKGEFENIIVRCGMQLPQVSQFDYYKECFKLLQTIEIRQLQQEFLKELKCRMKLEIVKFSREAPEALRFLTYFDASTAKRNGRFNELMHTEFGG